MEVVTAHAHPSVSRTETWVVEPSRSAPRSAAAPGWAGGVADSGVVGRRHRREERECVGRSGAGVEGGERAPEQCPTRARRRVREHLAATVFHVQRLSPHHLVRGQVVVGDHAAAGAHPFRHGSAHVTGVKGRRPLRAQPVQRVGELGIAQQLSLARRPTVHKVPSRALRTRRDDAFEQCEQVRLHRVHPHPPASQRRGGGRELRKRRPPELLDGRHQARGQAVRAARGRADVEELGGIAEGEQHRQQRHTPGHVRTAAGRLDEEVQQHGRPVGWGHEQVPARAQTGEQRLGHQRREHRGHRRVHGVAACTQHRGSRCGGGRMPGRHHSPARHGGPSVLGAT